MRLLHLEDDANDQILVEKILRADGLSCEVVAVQDRAGFETALRDRPFDLIISDFTLPSFDGMRALALAQELSPATPFIFYSGTIGEEAAVESLKKGAIDYILKQRPQRLVTAVRNALHNAEERTRRRRAENDLKKIEERFRIISRATNDVIWEWDIQTNQVWLSENFKNVFGHSPEAIGATFDQWMDLVHPDDKGQVISRLNALIAGRGRIWWSEHRFRRADGSYVHIFDRASVVYDAAGKLARMVGVMIDMTERKHAEEKIIEQAALLDEAQDAIIVSDLKGRILFWSKGAERIYGRTVEEVLWKSVEELLRPATSTSEAAIKETLKTGSWMGELREQGKSGDELIVQSRWTLLRDSQGKPKSIMVINTDVTKHKQMEEQFLRSQRLESLGMLVSGIAHDLNNTLAPIVIGIQMMRLDSPEPETESLLQTMEISAKRSADMLKQMLTFARGGEIQKTLIQPADLVTEMGNIVSGTFSKMIQCRVQTGRALHPLAGIPTQLHQVLMNLCVNARDAMPKGGTITLSADNVKLTAAEAARHDGAKPGNYVCLSVADTGTGIPPEQLGKIFQPFFTTKAPGKGTGLGLSASSNIIKNHGGFMTVDSQPGRGTEFKVLLPAAGKTVAEPVDEKVVLPAGHGECVLVIDNEAAILAIIRATLESYGYAVMTAASGAEAIAQLGAHAATVNLAITGLDLPFMDGQATIANLRKISSQLKIIVVSGSEPAAVEASRQLKADAVVVKPFTNEMLIRTVHAVLTPPGKI